MRIVFIACTRLSSVMSLVVDSAISKRRVRAASNVGREEGRMVSRRPRMMKGRAAERRVMEMRAETMSLRCCCCSDSQR